MFLVDWRRRTSAFFAALQVERNVMFLILTLIVLVAALNIVSGLIMLVKDKGGDIAILLDHGGFVAAAPGETLVREGDVGDAFYVLASGHVDVIKAGEFVRDLGAGAHFGEVALLEDVPRTASVVARTPVRAFRLDREGFEMVVERAFRAGSIRRASDRSWEH